METIVRELLSSSVDLSDPSAPLSAPDLHLLITRLDSHSLQIKSRIRSYLVAHHGEFATLFSLCDDVVSCTDEISRSLSELLGVVSDCNVDIEIKKILDGIREKSVGVKEKREILEFVDVVLVLRKRFQEVHDSINKEEFRVAAKGIRDLKEAVRVGEEEGREPLIYGLFRNEWSNCFDKIQEALLCIVGTAVIFDSEPKRIKVQNVLRGVDLCVVLESMEVLGVLDYGLAKVADKVIKFIVLPFISSPSTLSIMEGTNEDSIAQAEATMTIVDALSQYEHEEGELLYRGIIQVVKFISESICFQNHSWINCFGRLTWPRISNLIISHYLSKEVPEEASELNEFQKIISQTSQFELTLKEMAFVSESDTNLSSFAKNVEVHFATRKRKETLTKARNILLQCDISSFQDPSSNNFVDLLVTHERFVVSPAATSIMNLVHQNLQDCCVSSPLVAAELYNATRDAILLYEAIVPAKLEKQLNGVNMIPPRIHNDCMYLYQEILSLSFQYRPKFPSSINDHVVFVDIAPRFRTMADDVLENQIHIIIFNLGEAIDGADGFQNTHQMLKYESAKFSIDQVAFILEKVHLIWEPILRPSVYKKCMSRVLESVVSRVTRDILLIDDMAAEETLQLQRLIDLMVESLSSLVESVKGTNLEEEYSTRFLLSWRKIQKLGEMLDIPLKSITESWESGELFRCGFSSFELKDFIKAIFTDSPLRKECLYRIQQSTY